MKCQECGYKVKEGAKRCPHCGAPVTPEKGKGGKRAKTLSELLEG